MTTRLVFVSMIAIGLLTLDAVGQQWKWPEKAANLKVLPADTDAKTLQNTMIGFSQALGVRCWFCHVGEEGKPLSTFDFVSDEKQTKETARLMIEMVKQINSTYLSKIDKEEKTAVNCLTCHRNNATPEMLEQVLFDTYKTRGIAETIASYRKLRQTHYGGFTYDFREPVLLKLAGKIDELGKFSDVLEIHKLNAEFYPNSASIAFQMADVFERMGNKDMAIEFFEKTLQLNPEDRWAKKRLEELKKK